MQHPTLTDLYAQALTLADSGRQADAIKMLYPAVQKHPSFYQGWLLFSRCLYETGHVTEAVQIAQHAEKVDPLAEHFQRIQLAMQKHSAQDAAQIARGMLNEYPHHPKALFTLASIALFSNQPESSVGLLEPGTKALPANMTLRRLLADSYVKSGQYGKAIDAAKVLVTLDKSFENVWLLLGLLFKYSQYNDFLEYCDVAGQLANNDKNTLSQLALLKGQVLRILGQRKESIDSLRYSLALSPHNAEAWWALADFKDYTFTLADKQQLQDLMTANISAENKCLASFTYARLSEAECDIQGSFRYYQTANSIKAAGNHQIQAIRQDLTSLQHHYTTNTLLVQADQKDDQQVPVFIVGLPRSGSTLIEQILASHSEVESTIEQPTLLNIEQRMHRFAQAKYNQGLPELLGKLSAEELAQFGQAYLDESAIFRSKGTCFFTDKQPFNFRLAGLIHKILPQAKIINVVRNPMDCGLSLYKQYFHAGVDFSYDLTHIGGVYNDYMALMHHWDSVLPGKVLRVQYEQLVREPESNIRRILQHLGLSYEPACLSFHTTKRAIHTASSEQVRQPINNNGIGTWLKFENELQTLQNSLEPAHLEQSLALKQQ